MKRLLIAAAALGLMAGPALAQGNLLTSGVWTSYMHTDQGVCGMFTRVWGDNANGEIHVKYERDSNRVLLQFFKQQWTFNRRDIPVFLTLVVDSVRHEVEGRAFPANNGADAFVELVISPSYTAGFLELFADAKEMNVQWKGGNEPGWSSSMEGSRNVSWIFQGCMRSQGGDPSQSAVTGSITKPF
jgi:hypothetical protein